MQRSGQVDLLILLGTTFDHLDVVDDCPSLVVRESESSRVRNPAMDSSTTRVDPEEVGETKVICFGRDGKVNQETKGGGRGGGNELRSVSSRTLTAMEMKRQQRLHMALSLQQVRIESSLGYQYMSAINVEEKVREKLTIRHVDIEDELAQEGFERILHQHLLVLGLWVHSMR